MRLWHKDLITALPRQQLLSQWRECCAIASKVAKEGSPNHLLVNPIMKYPLGMFTTYTQIVLDEMRRRGYKVSKISLSRFRENIAEWALMFDDSCLSDMNTEGLYDEWHNAKYFRQCYYNLEEKHDRGGIPEIEWKNVKAAWLSFTEQEVKDSDDENGIRSSSTSASSKSN